MTDLALSSLLITKFCHDLAGPLGGLQNGVEFLGEDASDPDTVAQATALLALSSDEAAARLQLFRQAYGTFIPEGSAEVAELERHIKNFFSKTKIKLEWDVKVGITQLARSALWQMLSIAAQIVVYGGTIRVSVEELPDGLALNVSGIAEKLHSDAEIMSLLEGKALSQISSPKLAHAFYWQGFAKHYGIKSTASADAKSFTFRALLPA